MTPRVAIEIAGIGVGKSNWANKLERGKDFELHKENKAVYRLLETLLMNINSHCRLTTQYSPLFLFWELFSLVFKKSHPCPAEE